MVSRTSSGETVLRSETVNKPRVHVIDYGLGNLLSVAQGLVKVGATPVLTAEPEEVLEAKKLILPGVGAFPVAMNYLSTAGLDVAVVEAVKRGVPILGICLGMQLLFETSSEFGDSPGLGLIGGRVVPILSNPERGGLRSTHIGWRKISWSPRENALLNSSLNREDSYYFVHSFAAEPSRDINLWASVTYGGKKVAAVVGSEKVWGTQFHPEKSGEAGLRLLKAFVDG